MKRIALRWLGALLLSITLAAPAMAAGKHLINGIDASGLDAAPAEDAMRKGKPVQEVGVFGSDEFGVAIRKDDAETMKLVNEGYKLLKADPYWKELQAKYLGSK